MAVPVEKSRGFGARDINVQEDCLKINWIEKDVCIKCERDGKLLICCDIGCPIAVHEKCMGCRPKFDDMGNFYCPYCSYKRAVAESSQAREKAMLAKKALSIFIDQGVIDANPQKEKIVTTKRKKFTLSIFAENDNENMMESDAFQNQCVPLEEGHQELAFDPECTTNNLLRERADESIGNKLHEVSLNGCGVEDLDAERLGASSLLEEATLDGALHISTKQKLNYKDIFEKNEDGREVEEEMHEQAHHTTIPFTGGEPAAQVLLKANRGAETHESICRDANIHAKQNDEERVQPLNVGSSKRSSSKSSSELRTNTIQNEKIINSIKLRQPEKLCKQLINVPSPSVRRKKLPWRDEEEEMLKEGVHKFSSVVNKNIPWRKILEFGRHVFDGTRTPADLKDKWRNVLAK